MKWSDMYFKLATLFGVRTPCSQAVAPFSMIRCALTVHRSITITQFTKPSIPRQRDIQFLTFIHWQFVVQLFFSWGPENPAGSYLTKSHHITVHHGCVTAYYTKFSSQSGWERNTIAIIMEAFTRECTTVNLCLPLNNSEPGVSSLRAKENSRHNWPKTCV